MRDAETSFLYSLLPSPATKNLQMSSRLYVSRRGPFSGDWEACVANLPGTVGFGREVRHSGEEDPSELAGTSGRKLYRR